MSFRAVDAFNLQVTMQNVGLFETGSNVRISVYFIHAQISISDTAKFLVWI